MSKRRRRRWPRGAATGGYPWVVEAFRVRKDGTEKLVRVIGFYGDENLAGGAVIAWGLHYQAMAHHGGSRYTVRRRLRHVPL